jgi:DTW domain-containing protein YfiP
MRPLCPRCERPLPACLCGLLPAAAANRIELQILQHPDEAGHAKGTATLLRLGLQRVQLETGLQFAPRPGLLLYPGAGPAPIAPAERLILLDGSWRGSRALLRSNPWLLALPRYGLPARPGAYAIRRAHRPGQLSSLEAGLQALAALEGDATPYAPLLAAFDAFVARELARAGR